MGCELGIRVIYYCGELYDVFTSTKFYNIFYENYYISTMC